jgi:glutathione peroxidase
MNIYDFTVNDHKGKPVPLSIYQGKILLLVNTATHCGFTPQYAGLQGLYDTFKDQGFFVLDFPCNQFAQQAPGTDDEIHDFCTLKYATTFPRFAKIDVNGPEESPLYTWLKSQKKGIMGNKIKWNFTKFLIDRQGQIIGRYAPTVPPEKLSPLIQQLL